MAVKVEWTTAEQRALIHEQALGLLERMGMRFGRGRALDVLAGSGAQVDVPSGVARIPPDLVERALSTLPEVVVLGGGDPEHDCVLDGTIHFLDSGTPTHTVDFETGAYRATTADDLRKATVILEEMPSVDIMWPIVAATDVPGEQRILTEIAVTLSKTRKHVQHELEAMWQVEPILQMMEICGGEEQRSRHRLSLVCCTASPMMAHGPMLD
ncbi:MAG TPA: trimethylamine methyltransferase family protein, partial [Thermoleophilia bacterium]|nr:trimethylamine methyltransferase family protein [Thermoleophilia bacterium]